MITIKSKGVKPNLRLSFGKLDLFLIAARAYGLQTDDKIHRYNLIAFIQSHIVNNTEQGLQKPLEKDKDNWFSDKPLGKKKGTGFYSLTKKGYKNSLKYSKILTKTTLPVNKNFLFWVLKDNIKIGVKVNIVDRHLEPYLISSTGRITNTETIFDKIYPNKSKAGKSLPREIFTYILKSSYEWEIENFTISPPSTNTNKNSTNDQNLNEKEPQNESQKDNCKKTQKPEENYSELDDDFFLNKLKKQMEKGHSAEEIVLKNEKYKLEKIGRRDLADKVENVSHKIGIGYDILSYEIINGKDEEKQIEVKSVGNHKRFFLTRNELNKSTQLNNYYIILVDTGHELPKIIEIKHPDLSNNDLFEKQAVSYEVKYKK